MRFRRLNSRVLVAGMLGIAGVLGAAPVIASMVLAMDLPELTARADRIVVAEVMSVRSGWDKRHERILSTVEIQVAEIWKGQMPGGGRLTLVQPGGSADGIEMRVHGLPAFTAGERAVLFLRGASPQSSALLGMGQGKRGMRFEAASKRWMVDGGDRSAAVTFDGQGRPQNVAPAPSLPIDELRRQVRDLVKKP
jgi:hypothetical protein